MTDIQGLPLIAGELREPFAAYKIARRDLLEAHTKCIESCQHATVLEAPWQDNMFGSLKPLRMCAVCRCEEEGSHWSGGSNWSANGFGKAVLGNADHRLVVACDRDAIYKLRLPGDRRLMNKEEQE